MIPWRAVIHWRAWRVHAWRLQLRGHYHIRLWALGPALHVLDHRWSSLAIHGWLEIGCVNLQLSLTHYT